MTSGTLIIREITINRSVYIPIKFTDLKWLLRMRRKCHEHCRNIKRTLVLRFCRTDIM